MEFQINNYPLTTGYIIGVTLLILYVFISRKKIMAKKSNPGKSKLFKAIDNQFKNNLINDKSDIEILVNSVSREFEHTYSIAPIIEDYLTYKFSDSLSETNDQVDIYYKKLKEIMAKEYEQKPFADVPVEERRLLISIKSSLKGDDIKNLEFLLDELKTVLETKGRIYQRTIRMNKWSMTLAVIGILSTFIFGGISIVQSISYEKIVNEKPIE